MRENIDENNKDFQRSRAYWKEQLAGMPPLLDLPVDHTRRSFVTSKKALSFLIPKACRDALNKLSRQCEATLFMTLLAAYKTLLYRYTNQEDIAVACSMAGTSNNDPNDGKSYYLNTRILRTDLSGDPGFYELMARIRRIVTAGYAHEALPFKELMNALKTGPVSVPSSLFQVMFAFRSDEDENMERSALVEHLLPDAVPPCDLRLLITNSVDGLSANWEYNENLFDADSMERMAAHFQTLLEGMISNPEQNISALPLLTAAERHQIIYGWNTTGAGYPHHQCIHELFEQQVERSPEAVALTLYGVDGKHQENKLTYQELNIRANQLAHYLRSLGVRPESLVGICVERSLEMVVGILGILKAGGAYLPMDPSYPKERLNFMLGDARVEILLTQERLVNKLTPHNARTICLDTDWNNIIHYTGENTPAAVTPDNLAYVIYTSGSTGKPKGTLIIHRGVVNYLSWCTSAYAVADGNGAPVNSSFAFDATVTSLFSPLLSGKTILLLPETNEIEALCSVLTSRNRFSLVKITPAHLQILAQMLPNHQIQGQTNALVIGGENLPAKSLELWLKHAPGTRLINEYGPTETVVGCCVYEATGKKLLFDDVPIGRPIANTQMYILDRHMQPVPVGMAGEIYIGGHGVARGYINRPDLTAERFVADPFNHAAGARLYRTGDSGRYLRDGNIVFLGRLDHQVKIRGYRIELGEIESTLARHPSVQQVVVLAREDSPGDKRLVAYMVPAGQQQPAPTELRRFLKEQLPEYMVPAAFVFMDLLPLTTNGKIDRAALPPPDQQRPESAKNFLAPRDKIERKLTKIFEECLKVSPVGVKDNFFDLGVHSIQAAFIFSRIRKSLGAHFHMTTLLKAPTVEQLAALIRRKDGVEPWSAVVPIQPNGSKPPLFCVHGGVGTVLFYRQLALRLGQDQPFYGLQAKGLNGIETPHTNIQDMAAHYIRAIRTVQPAGPYYLGGYCFGGVVAFEMAKQLTVEGQQVALLANFNAVSPVYVHPPVTTVETDKMQMDTFSPEASAAVSVAQPRPPGIATKLAYFYAGMKKKLTYRVHNKMKRTIYKYCFAFKRPLPEAFARYYLYENNSGMVSSYQPQPYDGRMIIFRSPGIYRDPHLGWTNLVKGSIETCDIPGNHPDRRHILIEPFVEILAGELKKYM